MGDKDVEETLATEAPFAPVTSQRKVRSDLEDSGLPKPYLARAYTTPDTDKPTGTPGRDHHGKTVLQQHVSFFDQNKDGIIYPWESYKDLIPQFRVFIKECQVSVRLGQRNWFDERVNVEMPNSFCSYNIKIFQEIHGWIPNPLLPLYVENIHREKHGSDSTTYDTEGRYVPMSLENIFSKYARTQPDKLTLKEIFHMTESTRASMDVFGWVISKIEWGFLYWLAHDKDGFLAKEAVRSVFDGSLFEYYAEKNKKDN